MNTIRNLLEHPMDATSLLMWILDEWDRDPRASLVIVCRGGQGKDVLNRVRVRLSKIRKSLKDREIRDVKQFGIDASIIPWSLEDGYECDAVTLERTVEQRHRYHEIAIKVFSGKVN